MNSKQSYILSRNSAYDYTDNSIEGLGVIKGANCEIDSITPSPDGLYSIVVFGWTGTGGTHMTSEMTVENGVGIKGATIDADGHLIVTYDDDTTKDAGEIPTKTVEVGDTETLDYDEFAEVTQTDTETGIKLNFKIPRGEPGESDPIWHNV